MVAIGPRRATIHAVHEQTVSPMQEGRGVMRIVIAGAPHTGKSTLSHRLAYMLVIHNEAIHHTDELTGVLEWSEASLAAMHWLEEPGPLILEGVAGGRVLRKYLAAHPGEKPCDVVYWLTHVWTPYTKPGQERMAKGCTTVFREIAPTLTKLGVEIRTSVDDTRVIEYGANK